MFLRFRGTDGRWGESSDPTGEHEVVTTAGTTRSDAAFHVDFLPREWDPSAGGSGWSAKLRMNLDGEVWIDTVCHTTGIQLNRQCGFYFYRNGGVVKHFWLSASHWGGRSTVRSTERWLRGLTLAQIYEQMRSTWSIVELDSAGDPNAQSRIPMLSTEERFR